MTIHRSLTFGLGLIGCAVLSAACASDASDGAGSAGASHSNAGAGSSVAGSPGAAGANALGGAGSGGAGSGSAGTPSSTGGSPSAGGGGAGGALAVDCSPTSDPLKTNSAKQDAYDCAVIAVAKKWGMPDAMIVKSQIQQESSFQVLATSGDSPCGIKEGWTDAESKSFGLIQTTPACGEALTARLPNGHPNLTKDMSDALWASSVFNPTINLDEGVKTDVDNMKELKKKYPSCTAIQYNMMAAGAFNSGTDAITGCGGYNDRAQQYVTAITSHYHEFAKASGWPDPY